MSKAEEFAYSKYPKDKKGVLYDLARNSIIKGYHQAEKDLELTWKDVKEICVQSVLVEVDLGGLVSDEIHYTEVLKRFNEQRKEK